MKMNAIRQTVAVKNHTIQIELPKDFEAETVEVIIFQKEEEFFSYVSEEEKALMRERTQVSEESDFEDWSKVREKYV